MVERNTGWSAPGSGGARGGVLRGKAHPTLIGTLVRAGRIREAIGVGEGSLARGVATREECEALARAYWALGMGRSAERLSKGLAQQRPPSVEGLALLGEIYAERMWAAQLQAVVRRLAVEARWHPQLVELTRALETLGVEDTPPEGEDVESLVGRAEWCLKRGWIGEAEGILKGVLEAQPRHARAQELLWGCQRERRLEARFGPMSPSGPEPARPVAVPEPDDGESDQPTVVAQAAPAAVEHDEFHIEPSRLSDMMQPAQVVEALAEEQAAAEEEDEDEEDWDDEDEDEEDEEEDEDDLDTFSSGRGGARLQLSGVGGGPSPLKERLRDHVLVIERGDRPRMIDANDEDTAARGLWFRGSRELIQDPIDGSTAGSRAAASAASREPRVTAAPRPAPTPEPDAFLAVGRYGFDDEDESATEVMAKANQRHRHRRVVSLLRGDDGRGAVHLATQDEHQWDEVPTRAVVDDVLKQAFIDEEEDTGTRILEEQPADHWEKEVATRVAEIELGSGRGAGSHEPTVALPHARPAAAAAEATAPLAPASAEATVALPTGEDETKALPAHLMASSTHKVPRANAITQTAPRVKARPSRTIVPVPEAPSMLTSPALILALVACVAVAWGFYRLQLSRYQDRVDAVAAVVESMLLKGDATSVYQAQQTVASALEPTDPDPVFEAMEARVSWLRWNELGGGTVLAPDAAALAAVGQLLGPNRDLALAHAHRDLYTGDWAAGITRIDAALQAFPQDPLLGAMKARLLLAADGDGARARPALEAARGWVAAADLPAGASGEALRPLVEADVALVGVMVEHADGKDDAARKHLEEVAFLNPAHPWLDVWRVLLSVPATATPSEALQGLARGYDGLAGTVAARPRAWLLAQEMDLAVAAQELDSALGLADRVMTTDPTWPQALYRSTMAQVWRGDYPLALQRVQQGGDLAPLDPDLLEARVMLLLDAQRFGAAEAVLGQLPPGLEETPQVARARAEVALARRDPAEAEQHLARAAQAAPEDDRTVWLQARVGMALEGKRRGRPPVEALLSRPERLRPGISHARETAMLAVMSSGAEARKLERDAIRLAPRDPLVREILAEGEEARGDLSAAQESLQDALKIAPERVRTQAMLARVLALAGDRAGARRQWEAIEASCEDGPLCAEVATLLETPAPPPGN